MINFFFKNFLKEFFIVEDGEREVLIVFMEVFLNEIFNGDIIVLDIMRIRNIYWNGISFIF